MSNFYLDKEFLKFVYKTKALKFGDFQLKDGTTSDVFFNSAAFDTGLKIANLARFFAFKIMDVVPNCTLVYGSAYKGIPLATAISMELSNIKGDEIGYLFNRKEAKEHGDKGSFVGRTPLKKDVIVFVDDVVTSGITKEEGITAIQTNFSVKIDSIFVAVDRRNVQDDINGCKIYSLTTLDTIREFIDKKGLNAK